MITTYERGKIAGQRETILEQLEAKFGELSPEVKRRFEALSPDQLRQVQFGLLKEESLKALGLEG
jgi:hypothetical protein